MRNLKKKYSIAAILLAAGSGKRMGGTFKQFIEVNGRPVIGYSLEKFIRCRFLNLIVIVAPPQMALRAKRLIKKSFNDSRIHVIAGGKTRRESSYNALQYLYSKFLGIDYVIIHDAARPLISTDMIRAVAVAAKRHGAAALGMRSLETVAEVNNSFIRKIPERALTYYTFTPHCFKFDWLWEAHRAAASSLRKKDRHDMELFINYGKRVNIIDDFLPTAIQNPIIKLTYPPDVKILKALL